MPVYDLSGNELAEKEGKHWNGKKWFAYGTSLTSTELGQYVPFVTEFGGFITTNKGIRSGDLVSNRNVYNALMDNTDGKLTADLITIEVGANDGGATLGTPLDIVNTTFCGSLNVCLKNILKICKAQVVVMDSTRMRYPSGGSLSNPYELNDVTSGGFNYLERAEAIRQCAEINGVYYIPFGSGLGLGLYREQSGNLYNTDHIHHTELGGYNLAQGVWSYLKNIPLWYSSMPT